MTFSVAPYKDELSVRVWGQGYMLKGFNSSPEEGHALKAQEEGMTWSVVEEVG